MGSSEKFCLRWNDFESNISVAFREIRDDNDFLDVTLSVGDRQIQAHKLILSACSPFFRDVLRRNPHPHPLLYLKGVDYSDLQAVLNFMYHGEVNVAQEQLHSFLAVAEDLKVKGLTEKNGRDINDRDPSPAPKRPRPSPTPVLTPDDDIQEVDPIVNSTVAVETLPKHTLGTVDHSMDDSYGDDGCDEAAVDEDSYNLVPDDSFTSADSEGTAMSTRSTGYITDRANSPSVASVTSIHSVDLGGSWDGQGHQSQIEVAQSLSTPKKVTIENCSEYHFQDDNCNEKIVLTKADQAKLKTIFSSFSREIKKGSATLWECTQCGREFKKKRLVDSHIDFKHTDYLIHQCLQCGRCFPTNDALTRHIGSAHNLKLNLESSNAPSIARFDLEFRTSTRVGAMAWIQMQDGIMKSQLLKSSDDQLDLQVGQFGDSGRGVITTRDRVKGEFVVEYAGDLINLSSAIEREKQYLDEEAGCFMYFFKHDSKQYCVDATADSGRLGRLINHSKLDPNLITKVVVMEGGPRLVLLAKNDIPRGTQLLFDYGDRDKETLIAHPWLNR